MGASGIILAAGGAHAAPGAGLDSASYMLLFHAVAVVSGAALLQQGVLDRSKTRALTPGSVSVMQPETQHYVWTDEETIGQVHSIGPWSVNYVNPADDPAKK